MAAVGRQVEQVVQQVHARGRQAEAHQPDQCGQQLQRVVELVRGEQRHQQQQVLQPMLHAHRAQVVAPLGTVVIEDALHLGDARRRRRQPPRRPDEQGAPRRGPDRQVARAVAGVVEATLAEFGDEAVALGLAGQVEPAVAGEHRLEEVQLAGHRLRDPRVGAGGQHQTAALALERTQVVQQFPGHGQGRDVDGRQQGQPVLQVRAPAGQPRRQLQQLQRLPARDVEQRLDERVGVQQRAVEVHHQRHRIRIGRQCRGAGFGVHGALHQNSHLASASTPCFHGTRCDTPLRPRNSARCATYQS